MNKIRRNKMLIAMLRDKNYISFSDYYVSHYLRGTYIDNWHHRFGANYVECKICGRPILRNHNGYFLKFYDIINHFRKTHSALYTMQILALDLSEI